MKDPGKSVVIGSRNGIRFMIMASCARYGQPEHSLRHGVYLFIDEIRCKLPCIPFVEPFGTDGEEAGRDKMFLPLGIVLCRKQITGNLLPDKLIVRLVSVEGINDIVTIAPRLRERCVDLLATRFRVASHV